MDQPVGAGREGGVRMVSKTLYQSQSVEWSTPEWLFDDLNSKFHFTLDPCCTHENAKCEKHYTKDEDGLAQSWEGERVLCNPPYGKEISKWMRKCAESGAELVMALCPARVDTAWFHDWVYKKADILFIRGRLKFGNSIHSAPFPSMICIYRRGETDATDC